MAEGKGPNMSSKFSSSFDDLLADGKRQFDDLSKATPDPRKPPRRARSKPGEEPVAVGKNARVIEGKVGGIDFRLTTTSSKQSG